MALQPADNLAAALRENPAALDAVLETPEADALLAWCASSTKRRDTSMAHLLAAGVARAEWSNRAVAIARERVVEGPLLDALACAPLLGDGAELALPENAEARARLEILDLGGGRERARGPGARRVALGDRPTTFEVMIARPGARRARGRVLAARCLEVSVRGMPPTADPELVGRTLQVLQPLLLHPEPLVWVHAARALGRLDRPDGAARGHAPRLGARRLARPAAARD